MIGEVLFGHLQAQESLSALLARHDGQAAIFNKESAADQDGGWGTGQYPRVAYSVDMTSDPERDISGMLTVDIICENRKQQPGDIEPILKSLIDGYFFTSGRETIRASWEASNEFTKAEENVSGVTLSFSLLLFPGQSSGNPDAVELVNKVSKEKYPDAYIVAYDAPQEAAWRPTDLRPALYWRLSSIEPCSYINDTWACVWLTAKIHLHVFSDSVSDKIAADVDHEWAAKKRLFFEDRGPFIIDSLTIFPGNDTQRVGQLTLTGTYGVLREEDWNPLMNIYINGGK